MARADKVVSIAEQSAVKVENGVDDRRGEGSIHWVAVSELPRSVSHPFYEKLDGLSPLALMPSVL
jgi:hypothetical protein